MINSESDFSISILVIDSDELSRRILGDTLSALGFNIYQAGNPDDAKKTLSERKIDLVMTDIIFPEGNGVEFMIGLKAERPQIPVIVLSLQLDNATRNSIMEAGADGVLTKPFRINLVEELITSTLMKYDRASLATTVSKRKILVVDDDESMLSFLVEAIKILGFDIVACRSAASAREIFQTNHFDLAISDYMLPDTNGIILLKEQKGLNPNIPIVIVTGYPLAYTPAMARADGVDGYIGKPFRINQLEQVIASLLYPEKAPKHHQ
jgi:DNA-binding NtrC family response regulator